MNRGQCASITSRLLELSRADETFVAVNGVDSTTLPFAANTVLPSAHLRDLVAQVTVRVGKRYATVSGNVLEENAMPALLRHAMDAVQRLPEVEEVVPFGGPVEVPESPLLRRRNADVPASWSTGALAVILERTRRDGLVAQGKIVTSDTVSALASSNGLFLFQPSSSVHCQVRVSTPDGASTGFSEVRAADTDAVDASLIAARASEKCLAWKNPVSIGAERLTTIFEAPALADLLLPFMRQFDTQAIAENRSFLRKLDGTSRLGTELFPSQFSIAADPYNARIPSMPFSPDGLKIAQQPWIHDGVISAVAISRYEAHKTGGQPVAFPSNFTVTGGRDSIETMIASAKRCLLVSGFAGLTIEDPANCLINGSTRDGLFLIENGKITRAVQNLIFRETPVYLFKRMEQIGVPEIAHPRGVFFPMLLPPVRVTEVMYVRNSGIV